MGAFGALLKRYREAAGLTQGALAERAGLSVRGISDLERGISQLPRGATVGLLAQALGLSGAERSRFEAAARAGGPTAALVVERGRSSLESGESVLVGRAKELALLDRHLGGEGPPVLLLAGAPGIGKSRLLREAQTRARTAGWTILVGGCQRGGGQDSYAPLPATLEQRMRRATTTQARAELVGCAWLARLLPEVAELGADALPAWTVTPAQERRLVVRAVERYLRNVAESAGTLLVLDDIQWAGQDGLDVLAALVERAEEIPLRVIAAYRSNEATPAEPLGTLLADLLRTGRATQGALEPLVPEEAAALLDALLAGRPAAAGDHAEVLRRARGLPYFLVSCVEGLAAGGSARVPETVAQSIRQRVVALSQAAQELLRAAAVVGRVAERTVLMTTVPQSREEVLEALEAACRAHLLEEEGAAAYRFVHDLVREVVETDLSAARRAALHQRVAEALESGAGRPDVEALAYHYSRSDAVDKAVFYLERAGDHAKATGANSAAEGYYRDLIGRLEARGRRADAARAYARLGLYLHHAMRNTDAVAACRLCIDRYLAGQLNDSASPQAVLAFIDEREPEATRGVLYLAYAKQLNENRVQDFFFVSERTSELARRVGDTSLLVEVLLMRGNAFVNLGRPQEHRDALEEARRLCEANDYSGLLVQVLIGLEIVYGRGGEPDQMGFHSARCVEVAEQIGDPVTIAWAVFGHMWYAFYTGDWARAQADLTRTGALVPGFAHNANFLCNQGHLLMVQGAWTEAAACFEEALDVAERTGGTGNWPRRMLAELDLVQGRPAAALTRLQELLRSDDVGGFGGEVYLLHLLAWAQVQLGHLNEAAETADRAVTCATTEPNYRVLPDALRVQGLVAAEHQQWAKAKHALEEGLAVARRTRYPYAEAQLLYVYAHLHRRKDEPSLAWERLEEALAIFQRLGARQDILRAEQQLGELASLPM